MNVLEGIIDRTAHVMGVDLKELQEIAKRGASRTYQAGDWLFHESTPREWLGIVESGEIDLVRGLQGSTRSLITVTAGGLISESVILDETPHSVSARTLKGAVVWQIARSELEAVRQSRPELFYRLVAAVAHRISQRLRHSAERLAGVPSWAETGAYRLEHDLLGDRELPDHVYYGVQTLRGTENFPISGIHLHQFEHFVTALAQVKKAAALANQELGVLDADKAGAIGRACDEIIAGKLREHFVVDMIQGGAGTSTNMNANEVIANRALELLGHRKGQYKFCHPNDDVNCSQSTNDAYPTALKIGLVLTLRDTLSAMRELRTALEGKEQEFADVLKMGRTENQDAVPMTLGQEFGAYAVMIASAMRHLESASTELLGINMGATAIGTGINSPPGYAELVTKRLAQVSGLPVRLAMNLVEATQEAGSFALMSGALKTAAVQLSKICNDLRWLSSGPRCGLGEIQLPAMQPGSSIMPGKVNPVIPEVVNQICYQIIGYDMTISMAAEASELELNMAEPIIAYDLLHGLTILRNACIVLVSRCITGIKANRERCLDYVQNSIGIVTALNPVLGYERSVAIAKEALATNGRVYDLILEKGWLTREQLDDILKPENMTHPRQIPKPAAV